MMPCRSTAEPIIKPGTSARKISGMLNASQSQTNLATLSEESTNSTPPRWAGWFATTPTTEPSSLASPQTTSLAKSGFTSKKESSSTTPATADARNGRRARGGGAERARLGGDPPGARAWVEKALPAPPPPGKRAPVVGVPAPRRVHEVGDGDVPLSRHLDDPDDLLHRGG